MTETAAAYLLGADKPGKVSHYFRCSNPNCLHKLAYITAGGDIVGILEVHFKARGGRVAVMCPHCNTWVTIPDTTS